MVFSNALGTAFGDFLVDVAGLGYGGAALVCTAVIALVLVLHYTRAMNEIAVLDRLHLYPPVRRDLRRSSDQ